MTNDYNHEPAHLDAIQGAVGDVLGRHLGTLLDENEAADILDALDRRGYYLTTPGDDLDPNGLDVDTDDLDTLDVPADIRVHININATDDTNQVRHAILNAREALKLELS